MGESDNAEQFQKSKINSAGLNNLRMHEIWNDANNNKRSGRFLSWNADLDAMWCELVCDVKKDDADEKEFTEMNEKLSLLFPILNWTSTDGFNKTSLQLLLKKKKQYDLLIKKETFLRRLQNKQGKGTAYEDDSDDFD